MKTPSPVFHKKSLRVGGKWCLEGGGYKKTSARLVVSVRPRFCAGSALSETDSP